MTKDLEQQKKIYVVIHGHFYQPPRENPFLETIEAQPSAFPYHDWNERIHEECYKPNTASRVLDSKGKVLNIANNFRFLSFNIGPTLSTWLEQKHPETYQKIIEADRISRVENDGNGNAIAQVYNHVIMPLIPKRDKITQILWGKKDFIKRFKREPEGMWLPETAINSETVECLIEHGIKFIILSPYQALRTRKIPDGDWTDARNGNIDTTRNYRVYSNRDISTDKSLAVIFYQKDISKAIAFEHLLKNASFLASRINEAVPKETENSCLINICTDGESYGHHEPFGDMCIAYFFNKKPKDHNFIITNYSNFLKISPPKFEVELNFGDDCEGTSWSCFHGVKRWKEDCGCSINKIEGWNQRWRIFLKKALDILSDELAKVYEKESSKYIHDPWEARNDYGDVIVNNWSESSISLFFTKHLKDKNDSTSKSKILKLLESQRYAIQMHTSCAWFFDDIEGIEAIQNLRFAAKACELVKEFTSSDFIFPFLKELEKAVGNQTKKTGKDIFLLETNPYFDTLRKIVHQLVVSHIFFGDNSIDELYGYLLRVEETTLSKQEYARYFIGRVRAESIGLKEVTSYLFICIQKDELDIRDYLIEIKDEKEFLSLKGILSEILKYSVEKGESQIFKLFKISPLGIKDILPDERGKLLLKIATQKVAPLRKEITEVFEKNLILFNTLLENKMTIPPAIKASIEYTFSLNLLKEADDFLKNPDANSPKKLKELIETAGKFNLSLDTRKITEKLSLVLENKISELTKNPGQDKCFSIKSYLETLKNISLNPSMTNSQNLLFEFLEKKLQVLLDSLILQGKDTDKYELINMILKLAEELNLNTDRFRCQLKPFEKELIELPRFWP